MTFCVGDVVNDLTDLKVPVSVKDVALDLTRVITNITPGYQDAVVVIRVFGGLGGWREISAWLPHQSGRRIVKLAYALETLEALTWMRYQVRYERLCQLATPGQVLRARVRAAREQETGE